MNKLVRLFLLMVIVVVASKFISLGSWGDTLANKFWGMFGWSQGIEERIARHSWRRETLARLHTENENLRKQLDTKDINQGELVAADATILKLQRQLNSLNQGLPTVAKKSSKEAEGAADPSELLKKAPLLSAPVIYKSQERLDHFMIIQGGQDKGVSPSMIVLSNGALLGVIDKVLPTFSRVRLVTDARFKFTAIDLRTQERAILTGQNKALLKIQHKEGSGQFQVDDPLVTFTFDRLLPQGVPVGTIAPPSSTGEFVKPLADFDAAEVQVVLLHFGETIDTLVASFSDPSTGSAKDGGPASAAVVDVQGD